MKSMSRWFRRMVPVVAFLFAYAIQTASCWAQTGPVREPPGFWKWLPAYGVIFLITGVGLMFLLKSAQRREKEKPEKNFEE